MSALFPELGESQPIAVRVGAAPEGKVLHGSPASARAYERLLGLPGAPAIAVEAVELPLETGHLALAIAGRAFGAFTLLITPCWPTPDQPRDFQVGLQGAEPDDRLRALIVAIQERLGPARYKDLLRPALRDPDRRIEALPEEASPQPDDDGYDRSLVRTWSGERAWREFYADKEQQRNFHHRLRGHIVMLEHGDLECHYATSPIGDGTMGFFNYSSIHVRPLEAMHDRVDPTHRDLGYLITDVQESDVIKGGIPKFDAALQSVATRENKPELVIARGTCPTIVIGDDMKGAVSRFQDRTGIPTVFLDHIEDGEADPFQAMFDALREGWTEAPPEAREGRINLVGFPRNPLSDDLRALVEALGLTINCTLIPDVELAEMRRFGQAELSVFFDSALYDHDYRRLLGGAPVPELRPGAPFGPGACRRWIDAIARATGREAIAEAVWELHWGPHQAAWDALVGQVEGYRLGFVVDGERLRLLRDPAQRTGTPVLALAREMGFAFDFVGFAPDEADLRESVAAIDAAGGPPSRLALFADEAGLAEALRASDAVAYYSEYFFDKRLTRCGKAQFSVSDLHMGLAGAMSSIHKLLRVCRLPFYRTYGAYLGAPFGGGAS